MSRVGKIPILIPQGVKVQIANDSVSVEGPKGKLSQGYKPDVQFKLVGNMLEVTRKDDSKQSKAYHGLYRNLVNNMVTGVSTGFTRSLSINGVGFRAEVKGKILTLNLGYSSDIDVVIPEGIAITVEKDQKITITGIDKQKVGELSAEIRGLRLPEPYKGKGIKYDTETIRRKVGKSGVK
jgi:large subunit ribosomal protein L6